MTSVLSHNPSAATSVPMRSLPPISTLVVAGVDKRNASYAFAMQQEDVRSTDAFLNAIFVEATKNSRAALGSQQQHPAACVCDEVRSSARVRGFVCFCVCVFCIFLFA